MNGMEKTFIGDVHEAVLLAKLLPNPTGEEMNFVGISMPIRDETGHFIALMITEPLDQITDAAARLSGGDDVQIPLLWGMRKFETLSVAIRHLVDSLTRKRGQLAVVEGIAYRDALTGLANRAVAKVR